MLEDVKTLLGFEDSTNDKLLKSIISIVTSRLMLLIGSDEVPSKLNYIITEVTVARFNRIGSEGANSHSVDGESLTWSDDDFKPYIKDIEAFRESQAERKKGVIRFI